MFIICKYLSLNTYLKYKSINEEFSKLKFFTDESHQRSIQTFFSRRGFCSSGQEGGGGVHVDVRVIECPFYPEASSEFNAESHCKSANCDCKLSGIFLISTDHRDSYDDP